jgi:hypothetical protein
MVVKYPTCSFRADFVTRFSKEEFVKMYSGTAFFKGQKQAEMLADCYDKAVTMVGLTITEEKEGDLVPPPDPSETEENDNIGYVDEA